MILCSIEKYLFNFVLNELFSSEILLSSHKLQNIYFLMYFKLIINIILNHLRRIIFFHIFLCLLFKGILFILLGFLLL